MLLVVFNTHSCDIAKWQPLTVCYLFIYFLSKESSGRYKQVEKNNKTQVACGHQCYRLQQTKPNQTRAGQGAKQEDVSPPRERQRERKRERERVAAKMKAIRWEVSVLGCGPALTHCMNVRQQV